VIVLSGSTDPQASTAVKALGADEYLSKPVDVDQLLEALSRVLGTAPQE
jgi:DNA-binding NarL/FixJ family response regulator